jgi:hypothetical protein
MRSRTPLLLVAGAALAGVVLAPATFVPGVVLPGGIGPTTRNLARRSCER